VLDKLNIQYMLANRVAMGRGLNPHRFLWVPFDDALMLPLDNTPVADNPDRKFFYQRERALLKKYMSEAGVTALPGTLDQYVAKVTTVLRKNSIGARKTMEMLSLSSLVSSPGDCRNLGANAGPITHSWPRSLLD
jgi:hypothetical protein